MTNTPFILYEASLLSDLQCLEQRADCGEPVHAWEISQLLERYDTSFDLLPAYLKDAIDRIDLTD